MPHLLQLVMNVMVRTITLLQPSIPGVVLPYTLTPNTFPNTGGVVCGA